ncbi:MAG: hypothetical protein AAB362_03675 [Patescibacteria group bacterium]
MTPNINNWKNIYGGGYGEGPSSYIKAKIIARLLKKYAITNYADIGCGKGLLLLWVNGGQGYDGRYQAVVANTLFDIPKDDKVAGRNVSMMAKKYIFIITQWSGARRSKFDSLYVHRKYDSADIQALCPDFNVVESFIWGFPMYSLYYRILEFMSSEKSGVSGGGKLNFLNPLVCLFFMADGLFKTKGRLIVAVLRRK